MSKVYFIMMNERVAMNKSGVFAVIDEDKIENFIFTREEAIKKYKEFWNDDPEFISFEEIPNVEFAPFIVECQDERELKTMKGCSNMRFTIGWILKTSNTQGNFFDFIDKKCSLYDAINFSESFPDGEFFKDDLKECFGKDANISITYCDPSKYLIEGISKDNNKIVLELSKDVFDDVMVHIVEI